MKKAANSRPMAAPTGAYREIVVDVDEFLRRVEEARANYTKGLAKVFKPADLLRELEREQEKSGGDLFGAAWQWYGNRFDYTGDKCLFIKFLACCSLLEFIGVKWW